MTTATATEDAYARGEGFAADPSAADTEAGPRNRLVPYALLAGAATLFLAAAATVEIGYTIRPSYALLALACALGVPTVIAGWRAAPLPVAAGAAALLVCYCLAAALGQADTVTGEARAGQLRAVAYLADLAIGLAVVGLVLGFSRNPRLIRLVAAAIVAGAAVGAAYAAYQWVALHYGWPLSQLNNTTDSNGVTAGASQGNGLLGWERARGTFLEPHFLAGYLASLLPLAASLVASTRGAWNAIPKAIPVVATAVMVFALLTTSSLPAWTLLAINVIAGTLLLAVFRRRRLIVAVASILLVGVLAVIPIAFLSPETAATLTGRSPSEIEATTTFRTSTWNRVGDVWAARPLLGYGPGQSSVQLTLEGDASRRYTTAPGGTGTAALESAQGLWAASLLDAGIFGLGLWIAFLGAILVAALQTVWRDRSALAIGVLLAALTAVLESQISFDRLDLRVWLLLGLALAIASQRQKAEQS